MTDYPTFKNPPIIEALLDFQVTLPSEVDLEQLARVQDQILSRYPVRQDRMHWEIQAAEMDTPDPSLSRTGGQTGYLFLPQKGQPDRALQARMDGFTFSKLKPYDTWRYFRDEAKELWAIYCEVAKPLTVTRLGLRTINSIALPLPFSDFKEYILTSPDIAPGLAFSARGFFMQLVVPQLRGEVANITLAVEPASQENNTAVTLAFDIDVYIEEVLPPDSEEIWQKCEILRDTRNEIFFKSLTSKAKGLF